MVDSKAEIGECEYNWDIFAFKYEAQTALFKDPVRTAQ